MSAPTSLAALENAHDEAITAARDRIEQAEEHLSSYRSHITRIQESFHEHATRHGISQHPGFQAGLQRVSEEAEENIWQAGRMIIELDEDLHTLTGQHAREREQFLDQQRQAG